MVKRYSDEPGRRELLAAMRREPQWLMSRIGYVETLRPLLLAGLDREAAVFQREWEQFYVVGVDHALTIHAAELAVADRLRTLDAIHLASALNAGGDDLVLATWDRRLHAAARRHGLEVLPAEVASR